MSFVDIGRSSVDSRFFGNRKTLFLLEKQPNTMEEMMHPNPLSDAHNSKTARLAASVFFLSLPLALWGLMYVPPRIFVPQDPIATTNNLLSTEFIFRTATV